MTTEKVMEQIAELKEYAGARHGEIARICWKAAETIEELAKRVKKLERALDDDRR